MPIELIATPTVVRRHLQRLIKSSERIDVFVPSFSDPQLAKMLTAAAERGTEVNLTTILDTTTDPDAIGPLHRAGGYVGVFSPATHRRRAVAQFKPGVIIFDNETDWWTAAIVGSFTATEESLSQNLEAATLVESSAFSGDDPAGDFLLQVLNWGDSINHAPVDDIALAQHRKLCGKEADDDLQETAPGPLARIIETKPAADAYVSSLSWQELRRCDWGTYWDALLEADERRRPRADGLFRPKGWLNGIDAAQSAFRRGPDGWADQETRDELLGLTPATQLLGRISNDEFVDIIAKDSDFRIALHAALERCIVDSSPGTMFHALAPIVVRHGVTTADISRILAAAAPDRFFSIAEPSHQMRMSSMVGFDLAARATQSHDQLRRFVDAIEMTRQFPWASTQSAERTSDHPRESDAWSKRVALLACLVA